jgi:hypothetical protein
VPNAEQPGVLRRVAERLASGGRIVVVEYDDRPASRWVPYPVSLARLAQLADEAELRDVRPIGRAESAFGGTMYAAHVGQAIERVRA